MDTLFSFVDAYAGHILTVIFGIATVYFYNSKETPKDSEEATRRKVWNVIVKVGAILLGVVVILMCYVNFTTDQSEHGNVNDESTGSTFGLEESENLAVNTNLTKVLEVNAYSTIEASSTYNGDSAKHVVQNLIDNKVKTNWTEGVHGNGEGEYIDFIFYTEQPIAGFIISAGNHASNTYYTKNSRPKTITLTFSDGSAEEYTLLDKKETQKIYFDNVVNTTSVRLTIDSVYAGSAWEDTVISEIAFLAQESH